MRRHVLLVGLFALLGVMPWGWSAGPPSLPQKALPGKAKRSLAELMSERVAFKGIGLGPDTTLENALDGLTKAYGVKFWVNERAFAYEDSPLCTAVERIPIVRDEPIPPIDASLGHVLQRILDRIPAPSGATFLVRRVHVEITTSEFRGHEVWLAGRQAPVHLQGDFARRYRGPIFPLVHLDLDHRPLKDALRALAAQADANIVLDSSVGEKVARSPVTVRLRNAPLDTAVLLLANMVDLRPVQLDNTFYLTPAVKAPALEKLYRAQRPMRADKEVEEEKRQEEAYRWAWGVEGAGGTGIGHRIRTWPVGETAPVTARFEKVPLRKALATLAGQAQSTVVLDVRAKREAVKLVTADFAKTPLPTAIRVLADMAGLKVVKLDRVLYVTTRRNAQEMEREEQGRKPAAKP